MTIFTTYLLQIETRRQVRAWLSANDPHRLAARSLFLLNRHARQTPDDRQLVYPLKTAVLEVFCRRFPYQARRQIQTRTCNRCRGSGEHWSGDICFACGGSGIYSTTDLYKFQFVIAGVSYSWHQIAAFVNWPVKDGAPIHGSYVDTIRSGPCLTDEARDMHLWVLYEYLRRFGQPPFAPGISLRFVVRFYAARFWLPGPFTWVKSLAGWLVEHRFNLPSWLAKYHPDNDQIPF